VSWLIWALLSAGFAGITAVTAKIGTSQVDANLATGIRTCVVLVMSWAIVFTQGVPRFDQVPGKAYLSLIVSGLATGLSWLCYFRALSLGPVSSVAPVDKLSVVFSIVLAGLFLGEALTWRHLIGGGFITLGAWIIASK